MSSESDGESSNASSEDIYSKIFNRNLSESSDVGDITKLLANVAISDEKVETTNEIVQTLSEENTSDSYNLNQNEQALNEKINKEQSIVQATAEKVEKKEIAIEVTEDNPKISTIDAGERLDSLNSIITSDESENEENKRQDSVDDGKKKGQSKKKKKPKKKSTQSQS